jgi:hypothetical protein
MHPAYSSIERSRAFDLDFKLTIVEDAFFDADTEVHGIFREI